MAPGLCGWVIWRLLERESWWNHNYFDKNPCSVCESVIPSLHCCENPSVALCFKSGHTHILDLYSPLPRWCHHHHHKDNSTLGHNCIHTIRKASLRNISWVLLMSLVTNPMADLMTSTLLHYISFEIWVVKYRWSIQIPKGQYRDHLVGQLTTPR